MRLSAEPVFGTVLAAAVVAAGAMGCAENESSLFVRAVLAAEPPDCRITADPGSTILPYGILDTGLTLAGYQASVLVGNQLVRRGSSDKIRSETARVSLRGAIVRVDDAEGNALTDFTIDGTGFVDPGTDTEPGYGLLAATLFPPNQVYTGRVTTWIKVFGRTLGGKELESNELAFPIDVCQGCLVSYVGDDASPDPGFQCAADSNAEATCIFGQDDPVPCGTCVGVNQFCDSNLRPGTGT